MKNVKQSTKLFVKTFQTLKSLLLILLINDLLVLTSGSTQLFKTNLNVDEDDVYSIQVSESAIVGQEVHMFSLESKKESQSECFNGFYFYYNTQTSENAIPFTVNGQNGHNVNLIVSNKLDYETTNKYFFIVCIDWDQCAISILDTFSSSQIRRKNCKQQIKLNVTILNDESDCEPFPLVQNNGNDLLEIKVFLNEIIQYSRITEIYHFNTSNCNSNNLKYQITSPFINKESLDKLFTIDGNSLQFNPFDQNLVRQIQQEQFMIIFIAKNDSQTLKSQIAKVKIINSEKELSNIRFINDDVIEIAEDCCEFGTSIMQIRININHDDFHVKYILDSYDYQEYFSLDPNSGILSLKHKLNSEQRSEYKLNVTAIIQNVNPVQILSQTIYIR